MKQSKKKLPNKDGRFTFRLNKIDLLTAKAMQLDIAKICREAIRKEIK